MLSTARHLPSYLVAAFIKRLSRLSLTAPPNGLAVILPFVFNLVRRHPNCEVLMHRPDAATGTSTGLSVFVVAMHIHCTVACRKFDSTYSFGGNCWLNRFVISSR